MLARLCSLRLPALCLCGGLAIAAPLSPALFPGLDQYTDDELRLHGLASLYPERILFNAPERHVPDRSQRAASAETLQNSIAYLRIYRFDEAVEALNAQLNAPSLIIDLRYAQSRGVELEFFDRLSPDPLPTQIQCTGNPNAFSLNAITQHPRRTPELAPPVILINAQTAGPFEAALQALQHSGAILCVGSSSAGKTAHYKRQSDHWIIDAEIQAKTLPSLIPDGLTPRIPVSVEAEHDFIAYQLYESGSELIDLLPTPNTHEHTSVAPSSDQPVDHILHRGIEIVAALQILRDYQP